MLYLCLINNVFQRRTLILASGPLILLSNMSYTHITETITAECCTKGLRTPNILEVEGKRKRPVMTKKWFTKVKWIFNVAGHTDCSAYFCFILSSLVFKRLHALLEITVEKIKMPIIVISLQRRNFR